MTQQEPCTSRQVRDHPQRATLRGDRLTITSYVGRSGRAGTYTLSRAAYGAAGTARGVRHVPGQLTPLTPADCPGNPAWARRAVVRTAAWPTVGTGTGGEEQAERIVDAQVAAIEGVLAKEEGSVQRTEGSTRRLEE